VKDVKELVKLAKMDIAASIRVANAEEELKKAKAALANVRERMIPELMDELEIDNIEHGGFKITMDTKIHTHVSDERRDAAMAWLRKHGLMKIIRHEIKVLPSTAEDVRKTIENLDKLGVDYKEIPTVHHSTLKSVIRSRLEGGKDVPVELFGYYEQRIAKVQPTER
jgi:hypothetical protein